MGFDFFLARSLGWGSVESMRAGMPNAEYLEWQAFLRYEAWLRDHAEEVAKNA